MDRYTGIYRGETAPTRTDVLWVHHKIKNDLKSPTIVEAYQKGQWRQISEDEVSGKSTSIEVDILPSASEDTIGYIYSVPKGDETGEDQNIEYVTIKNSDNTYRWERVGGGGGESLENIEVFVDNTTGNPTGTATYSDGTLTFSFSGLKGQDGQQGNTGSSVDYPYELVNNRTTDDATKGLTAAEGKRLGDDISQLEAEVNGVIAETVTVTGYNDKYGSYDFKAGVKYRITISTTDTVTLYYYIVDSDGNGITTVKSTSQFPMSFNFTPAQDYVGAQFALGNANTHNYEINIEYEALKGKVDRLESSVGSEVLYSTVHTGNSVNKQLNITPGSVYKLVLETSSPITVYLNSATNFQFIINANSGTYYIPVFDDGGSPYINLRRYSGDEFQLTYTLSRLRVADFVANIKSPVNYVKALSDALAFRWVQGYWTNKTTHNTNATWCNTEIQFNRGRQIRVTFSAEYYVVKRTVVFGTGECVDNGQITSGDTFNTSNWGPWIIGVRRVDRTPITPEQAAAAVIITQVGGEVYSMPFGADDVRQMINDAAQNTPTMVVNPRLGTNEIGRFMHHMNVESNSSIIPSQSIYDIAYAKSLGFKSIEANVHNCSDGVTVIKHGIDNKLGAGLLFADGSGLSSETLFSEVTSTALRENVTYNSPLAKYRGHIPTLDEFCAECARLDMIPFLRGVSVSQIDIARKYLPDERIIVEGPSTRGDFRGLMTFYGTGTKDAILANCAAKGMPYYYCWSNISDASDAEVVDVVTALHKNGFLVGGVYLNQNTYQRLAGLGLDICVSTHNNVPPFENGNRLNILRGDDSNLEMISASYDSTTQTISVQNGGKITINNSEVGAALSKICVKIRFSGTLDIIFKANDINGNLLAFQSDGTKEIVMAVSSQKVGEKIMEIVAQSAVTIYDIKVFASVVI